MVQDIVEFPAELQRVSLGEFRGFEKAPVEIPYIAQAQGIPRSSAKISEQRLTERIIRRVQSCRGATSRGWMERRGITVGAL